MDFPALINQFKVLTESAKDEDTLYSFMMSVKYHIQGYFPSLNNGENIKHDEKHNEDAADILSEIAADLRTRVPMEAQLKSEKIVFPETGQNADCDPRTTVHVDAFLYDDRLVDELCDEGKLPKSYCLSCGSRNTKPLTFISHSASQENLAYVFKTLLPGLKGKHVLDVGSRLGAVLYAAALYSQASQITGVEINEEWASISSSVVQKYNMQSKVKVLAGDIRLYPDVVASADVVILNNVFEFFAPPEIQQQLWLILRRLIKPGTLVLTCPSLQVSLSQLNTDINLAQWVQPIQQDTPIDDHDDHDHDDDSSTVDFDLIHLYRVL